MSLTTLSAALAAARSLAIRPPPEWVPLGRLLGRELAEAVRSRSDLPTGAAAAMDGWAVRSADTDAALRVVGESAAGMPWRGSLGSGEAVAISTGALLPEGADAVLRVELGVEEGGSLRARARPASGADIRARGEDMRLGQVVLEAGTVLASHHVGIVAACGHAGAACIGRPSVAVLVTGSELIEAGEPPRSGCVYDSNRHGLRAQAEAAGALVLEASLVQDDAVALRGAIEGALGDPRGVDLLVISGGMSVGRHDHARRTLADLGALSVVDGVAMRPGRPTLIARRGQRRILGLPGNPAAAMLAFHVLGRALLGAEAPWVERPLAVERPSRRGVDEIVRCRIRDGMLLPLDAQGAASLSSLASAQALAWLGRGRTRFERGALVRCSRLA